MISLLNLKRQYKEFQGELEKEVLSIMASGQYIMGNPVETLEKEMADYIGVKHAISCGNGTDALVLALKSLGIGSGDEVITTDYSFFATAEAIAYVGAKPVLIDISRHDINLNVGLIEKEITSKTKAIIPVHIFGTPCNMDKVMDIANKYDLFVIEDACQAIGAEYKNKKVGSFGTVSCFSFFPTKNLGAFGDGGMICTDDDKLASILRGMRVHGGGKAGLEAYKSLNHGSVDLKLDDDLNEKYYNYLVGQNSRLDTLQAVILRVKMPYLDEWNKKRLLNAEYYDQKINNEHIDKFEVFGNGEHKKSVYHMYVLLVKNRKRFISYMADNGISTGVYYPVPLHKQIALLDHIVITSDYAVSNEFSVSMVAIPCGPELSEEERAYIVKIINEYEVE